MKNLYGAGYTLEVKLKGGDATPTTPSSDRHSELKDFVGGLFPDAVLDECFADRMVFSVPQHAVTSLAECFNQLETGEIHVGKEMLVGSYIDILICLGHFINSWRGPVPIILFKRCNAFKIREYP